MPQEESEDWHDGHVSRLTIDIARSTRFLRELDPLTHETLSRGMRDMYLEDAQALGVDHLDWVFTGDGWDVWSGSEQDRLGLAAFALAFSARFHERLESDFKIASLKEIEKPGLRISLHSGSERRPKRECGPMDWLSDAAVQAARARDVCDPDARPFVVNQGVYEALLRLLEFRKIDQKDVEGSCKHGESPGTLYSVHGVRSKTIDVVKRPEETPDWLRPIEYVLSAMKDPSADQAKAALHEKARIKLESRTVSQSADAAGGTMVESRDRATSSDASPNSDVVLDLLRYASGQNAALSAYRQAEQLGIEVPIPLYRKRIGDALSATDAAFWLQELWRVHERSHQFGRRNTDMSRVFAKATSVDEAIAAAECFDDKSVLGADVFEDGLALVRTEDDAEKILGAFAVFGMSAGDGVCFSVKVGIIRLRDSGRFTRMMVLAKQASEHAAMLAGGSAKVAKWLFSFQFFVAQAFLSQGNLTEAQTWTDKLVWDDVREKESLAVGRLNAKIQAVDLLYCRGQTKAALDQINELIPVQKRLAGDDDPDFINTRNLRARLLLDSGQPAQAIDEIDDLLKVESQVFGEDHQATLNTKMLKADALASVGRYGDALDLLNDVEPEFIRVLGEAHLDTKWLFVRKAKTLLRMEDGDAALASVRHVMDALDRDDPSTFILLESATRLKALILNHLGNAKEALAEIDDAIRLYRRMAGDDGIGMSAAQAERAEILLSLDRVEEAETQVRASLDHFLEQEEGDRFSVQHCRLTLAECLHRTGKDDEAREMVSKALSWYRDHVLPQQYWRRRAETFAEKLGL